MLRVGVTGGIGSGKSVVCKVFHTLGIPVFNADEAASYLMENDPALISKIKAFFGDEIYIQGKLDKGKLAEIVFNSPGKLQHLNQLVHPATLVFANEWHRCQTAPYTIKEAALFFETGSNIEMDLIVGVYTPVELRINRVMHRSQLTKERVLARISKQMEENAKMKQCNFVIENDDVVAVIPQVLKIHQEILHYCQE